MITTISPNTANEEIIEYSGVDGTALTITVVKRWISPSAQALLVNGTDYNNTSYQRLIHKMILSEVMLIIFI